ncbi:MAG: hypothetical protein JWP29_221 [Rhodoferax sp.]|nr:hypothetical protein [Rhodoferax sp.]
MRDADSRPAPAPERGDDEARALRALRSLFWAAQEDYRQLEEITGLSPAEVRTLTLVAQHPGQTVSALAARMRLSLPSVSNMLRRLVADGLVTRTRLAQDQRTVLLHTTPQAQAQLSQSRGGGSGLLKTLIKELDALGLDQLNQGLQSMLLRLGHHRVEADPLPVTALRETRMSAPVDQQEHGDSHE